MIFSKRFYLLNDQLDISNLYITITFLLICLPLLLSLHITQVLPRIFLPNNLLWNSNCTVIFHRHTIYSLLLYGIVTF